MGTYEDNQPVAINEILHKTLKRESQERKKSLTEIANDVIKKYYEKDKKIAEGLVIEEGATTPFTPQLMMCLKNEAKYNHMQLYAFINRILLEYILRIDKPELPETYPNKSILSVETEYYDDLKKEAKELHLGLGLLTNAIVLDYILERNRNK